jgi:hypothetical protein
VAVPQLVLLTAFGTGLVSLALQATSLAFTGAATSTAVLAFTLLTLGLLI